VLTESFFNYPTMRYILKGAGASYPSHLRRVVMYLAKARVETEEQTLAVDVGDPAVMAAAALVDPPAWSFPTSASAISELIDEIGSEAVRRLGIFEEVTRPLRPEGGFYYLGMVGVVSAFRGRGYSRLLMDRVIEQSEGDPESEGVLLTTEYDANVALYESMGFGTLGEARLPDDRLRSRTMFRPSSAGAGG